MSRFIIRDFFTKIPDTYCDGEDVMGTLSHICERNPDKRYEVVRLPPYYDYMGYVPSSTCDYYSVDEYSTDHCYNKILYILQNNRSAKFQVISPIAAVLSVSGIDIDFEKADITYAKI